MSDAIDSIDSLNNNFESTEKNYKHFYGDQNFALHAVDLLYGAENLHNKRLSDLDKDHLELSEKISAIKNYLQQGYKHIKSGSDQPLNLAQAKDQILALWNEWKEELKKTNLDEYHNLKIDLDTLDFSQMDLDTLDEKLIPELEKIQRHHEFKFQQIPSKLRMFIELFSILVEILKEIPKRQDEMTSHFNRNAVRGG